MSVWNFALGEEKPDDPAGVTYESPESWPSGIDGWAGNGATLSIESEKLKAVGTGATTYVGLSRSIPGFSGKQAIIKVDYDADLLAILYYNGAAYVALPRSRVGSFYLARGPMISSINTLSIVFNYASAAIAGTKTKYISYIQVGTGAYLPTTCPYTDITASVDLRSVSKSRRLFTELRPNSNKVDFRASFTAALWLLCLTYEDIRCTITRDGVTYFIGYISPNYATEIIDGRKWVSLIVEDYTLKLLGQTIATTRSFLNYAVCDPAHPEASLTHALCALAGVTLAAGTPTILYALPYVSITQEDALTYGEVLSELLFEYGYVYYFNDAGELLLDLAVNTGDVTTAATFEISASVGNIRAGLAMRKTREKYDDVRVSFRSVELKTGLTLFEDTTGASGQWSANIRLEAPGDADGRDYYPYGARDGEVFAEYKAAEGLEVLHASSAVLEWSFAGAAIFPDSVVVSRALTNYFRRGSFALQNLLAPIPGIWDGSSYLTKVKITGSAYVVVAENTARVSLVSGKRLLKVKAKYIFATAYAQALASELLQYYAHSCNSFSLRSHDDVALGSYVLVVDSVYAGTSQKARIIGRTESIFSDSIVYDLESVADFESIALITESTAIPGATSLVEQIASMADDAVISPPEKKNVALRWQDINGNGSTTGSYWATRAAALAIGVPTASLDSARASIAAYLWEDPAILDPDTWADNIAIEASVFAALWSDYYSAESMTTTTISRWAKYAPNGTIDCGEVETGATMTSEYDCGEYPDWTAAGTIIDCGEPASSSDPPASIIDEGEVSAATPTENYDCGEILTAPDAPYPPRRVVDCGVYE